MYCYQKRISPLWLPFTQSISNGDWENIDGNDGFESTILKSIKKSPESFSGQASVILKSIPIELNTNGMVQQGVVGYALRMLKSEDLQIKNSGISILLQVYKRIRDFEAMKLLFTQMFEALNGKFLSFVAMRN
jgi:hypothetical protein